MPPKLEVLSGDSNCGEPEETEGEEEEEEISHSSHECPRRRLMSLELGDHSEDSDYCRSGSESEASSDIIREPPKKALTNYMLRRRDRLTRRGTIYGEVLYFEEEEVAPNLGRVYGPWVDVSNLSLSLSESIVVSILVL